MKNCLICKALGGGIMAIGCIPEDAFLDPRPIAQEEDELKSVFLNSQKQFVKIRIKRRNKPDYA